MGSTEWIREDYLRPLPTQREPLPWPDFPDFHLGIRLTGGGIRGAVEAARGAISCAGSGVRVLASPVGSLGWGDDYR